MTVMKRINSDYWQSLNVIFSLHKLKCPQGIESRDSVLAGNTIRHIKGGWRREEKAVSSCEKGCAHNCSSTDQVRSLLYAVQSLSGSHCRVPPGPSIHCPPVLSLTVQSSLPASLSLCASMSEKVFEESFRHKMSCLICAESHKEHQFRVQLYLLLNFLKQCMCYSM